MDNPNAKKEREARLYLILCALQLFFFFLLGVIFFFSGLTLIIQNVAIQWGDFSPLQRDYCVYLILSCSLMLMPFLLAGYYGVLLLRKKQWGWLLGTALQCALLIFILLLRFYPEVCGSLGTEFSDSYDSPAFPLAILMFIAMAILPFFSKRVMKLCNVYPLTKEHVATLLVLVCTFSYTLCAILANLGHATELILLFAETLSTAAGA